ncbi:pali-domain-containing protein [Teratosphaeria nubilosa]|uniref:Pali-domain-containing protein n=1 Tax=Teratosphaeria nubilosa TaxID=161662 RepID=A0A6G1KTL6_9PEZI|nr:pali-domain-containing protein [Teratosphaeria nubilosa]
MRATTLGSLDTVKMAATAPRSSWHTIQVHTSAHCSGQQTRHANGCALYIHQHHANTSAFFPDGLFTDNNGDGDFDLPSSTRHSLSGILIVHPIATFLALICSILAAAAHFHSPSHSPRFLLAFLIFTIPTLIVCLLAFLVDVLLFVPHLAWGGWIVLAAVICIVASSVLTCAMRRTLVSRKARKKRIAENADMNGAAYFENRQQNRLMTDELPRADSPPPMSGANGAVGKEAQFASYEMKRQDTREDTPETAIMTGGASSMDDQAPLNPKHNPSVRSASSGGGSRRPYGSPEAPPMPMNGRPSTDSNGYPRRRSRDQYGNPFPPGIMAAGDVPPEVLRHQGSQGSLGSNRSNGNAMRARGGYGPPGRGYGPPRGGYGSPRGGYGPPRGGYGPRGGYRGQGPPPPGFRGRGGYGPPLGAMGRGDIPRQGPPPGYTGAIEPYYNDASRAPTSDMPPPAPVQPQYVDEFVAGPIGQAIEMDERTGSPSPRHQQPVMNPSYGLRDSDGDVAGMVGLQQGQVQRQKSAQSARSQTSTYSGSNHDYVPPRAQWGQPAPSAQHPRSTRASPIAGQHSTSPGDSSLGIPSSSAVASSGALPLSPTANEAVSHQQPPPIVDHHRTGSDAYYEDVDPRFAQDPGSDSGAPAGPLPTTLTPGGAYQAYGGGTQRMASPSHHTAPNHLDQPPPHFPHTMHQVPSSTHIPSFVADTITDVDRAGEGEFADGGHSTPPVLNQHQMAAPPQVMLNNERDHSYETLPEGARSPGAGSDASHFTSISQRPVNPEWQPGPGSACGGSSRGGAPQRRREDVILNANPDFTLPGIGPPGRAGRGGRGGRGGMGAAIPPASGLTPGGRYPTEF